MNRSVMLGRGSFRCRFLDKVTCNVSGRLFWHAAGHPRWLRGRRFWGQRLEVRQMVHLKLSALLGQPGVCAQKRMGEWVCSSKQWTSWEEECHDHGHTFLFSILPSPPLESHPLYHVSSCYLHSPLYLTAIHSWAWRLWCDFILLIIYPASLTRDSCCVPYFR